jgi:hypothetical protein
MSFLYIIFKNHIAKYVGLQSGEIFYERSKRLIFVHIQQNPKFNHLALVMPVSFIFSSLFKCCRCGTNLSFEMRHVCIFLFEIRQLWQISSEMDLYICCAFFSVCQMCHIFLCRQVWNISFFNVAYFLLKLIMGCTFIFKIWQMWHISLLKCAKCGTFALIKCGNCSTFLF